MTAAKPVLLYYIHAYGAGHKATFRVLYPAMQEFFTVVALTTNPDITADLSMYPDLTVVELPPKWPPGPVTFEHTFSKAFEATPYGAEPAGRAAGLAQLIEQYRPVVFYCDGSPELAIMVRGMGVPVVLVHLHGRVMADPTQVFAHELADHIVAHFPRQLESPDYNYGAKTYYAGYLSRYADDIPPAAANSDVITIIMGFDNHEERVIQAMTADTGRQFVVLGNSVDFDLGSHCRQLDRVPDIAAAIEGRTVITAAGQNTIAELISLDKRLILLPEPRPYDEQNEHAAALASKGLALLADTGFSPAQWSDIIAQANGLRPDYTGLATGASARDVADMLRLWYA